MLPSSFFLSSSPHSDLFSAWFSLFFVAEQCCIESTRTRRRLNDRRDTSSKETKTWQHRHSMAESAGAVAVVSSGVGGLGGRAIAAAVSYRTIPGRPDAWEEKGAKEGREKGGKKVSFVDSQTCLPFSSFGPQAKRGPDGNEDAAPPPKHSGNAALLQVGPKAFTPTAVPPSAPCLSPHLSATCPCRSAKLLGGSHPLTPPLSNPNNRRKLKKVCWGGFAQPKLFAVGPSW